MIHSSTRAVRAARWLLAPLTWLFARLGARFYGVLAGLLLAVFAWTILTGASRGMQNQAYDLIVKNRFNTPPAHPYIVLVDIDEASLALMAGEYGRWPWPRSVMADFVERLARGGPSAVVFDITFVDPDLTNRDADAYLAEVAAEHANAFFSIVRLDPANDRLSTLRVADLAAVLAVDAAADPDATVAMIVPYFHARLSGLRLGTNNLYPGSDGIARRYHVYRDVAGWRIGSLPAAVAQALGKPLPDAPDVLLNWRGPPGVYPTLSFHELHARLTGPDGDLAAAELGGKIVVVGSSAASLFDLKPTPMAQTHPGFEILATAIDNLYTGDGLRQIAPWVYVAVTALMLALLTGAFVYNLDYRVLNPVFTVVQVGLLAISYLFLNFSSVFVDLSAPFTAALIFFFVARIYSFGFNLRRNGHRLFSPLLDSGRTCSLLLVRCALPRDARSARRARAYLLRRTGLTAYGVSAPRIFRQSPLLDALYRDALLLYWLVPADATRAAVDDLCGTLEIAIAHLDEREDPVHFFSDAVEFTVDDDGAWRSAVRGALLRALGRGEGGGARCSVTATPSFAALCREHEALAACERLRAAGLQT